MIGLIQRVHEAKVTVANRTVGQIGRGLVVFLGVQADDTQAEADKLARRIAGYRVFPDDLDKMNLDIRDIAGQVLVVSQFTLAADTRKGRRPSFSTAAHPDQALALYQHFCTALGQEVQVATGEFAADMDVHLINDGPVTFQLTT